MVLGYGFGRIRRYPGRGTAVVTMELGGGCPAILPGVGDILAAE
jgi:hypothetical protein